jgi:dipeptidase D
MSNEIRNLQPKQLWNHFSDLNAVPRASKKEERVIQFIMDFGQKLGLSTQKDTTGNVIIRKPATPGMENRKTIVLQSHLDMVHQKNSDTVFDFDHQGIDMYINDGWVKARGTTLGADNGIGVATIMTILAADNITHPTIEALFTIDEETGMTGAMGLEGGLLTGEILLNLDTEEDNEIDIGCAGGMDVTASMSYSTEKCEPASYTGFTVTVKGLLGGHSGIDIHRGRGNANKIQNRLLYGLADETGLRISEITGGSLRNAIPRESTAKVAVPKSYSMPFVKVINERIQDIKNEYHSIEPNLDIAISESDCPEECMSAEAQTAVLNAIYSAHNGVFRMSPDIKDLVEASNNVAKVEIKGGKANILCLTRSSVESSKYDVARSLKACFEMAGFDVLFSGVYPGWKPNPDSQILKVLSEIYEKQHGTKPHIVACHAGLECGILGRNYPKLDMISYGPTIKGAHSPDEMVNIASVQKFWDFTLEILKNIPVKG